MKKKDIISPTYASKHVLHTPENPNGWPINLHTREWTPQSPSTLSYFHLPYTPNCMVYNLEQTLTKTLNFKYADMNFKYALIKSLPIEQ
jgi:hypothetical protein